jgi:DnaJ-class molecular chaperone
MEQKDYYQILGVEKNADSKKIKEAYRKLAFKYHPDQNKENPQNAEKMKAINEAYAVLSNSEKRREYDTLRQQFGSSAYSRFRNQYTDQDIFTGSDIFKIFEEMTRTFGFRGYDEIFKEFYGNGYQTFEFKKPGFSARGFVFNGRPGRGGQKQMESPLNKTMGKFSRYVFKKISGVDFPEDGSDISDVIQLTSEQAREGGPYAYLDSRKKKKLVVKIPPGIKEGQRIRLAGMGEEGKGGGASGDLYLKVQIKKPLLKRIKRFIADRIK